MNNTSWTEDFKVLDSYLIRAGSRNFQNQDRVRREQVGSDGPVLQKQNPSKDKEDDTKILSGPKSNHPIINRRVSRVGAGMLEDLNDKEAKCK